MSQAPRTSRRSSGTTPYIDMFVTIVSYALPVALLAFLFLGAGLNFGFLRDSTNWDISSAPIDFTPRDPYWRAFLVGLLNTAIAGITAMIFAMLLGFLLAILRISGPKGIAALATFYCDVIRNIPVILQAMFWYATLLNLPGARDAIQVAGALLSNRGIYLPWPVTPLAVILLILAFVFILLGWARLRSAAEKIAPIRARVLAFVLFALGVASAIWGLINLSTDPLISWPELKGRNIRDGFRLQVEFLALVLALVFYRAAYISEIFRAGFRAVDPGQVEAARVLGLNGWDTLFRIRLPQALVTILPPLGSEFVLMIKITSIGLLVGFVDLYSVSVNTSTLTNRSMESIILLVCGYLLINLTIVSLVHHLNRRLRRRGQR